MSPTKDHKLILQRCYTAVEQGREDDGNRMREKRNAAVTTAAKKNALLV
jgi:hypothetical protein